MRYSYYLALFFALLALPAGAAAFLRVTEAGNKAVSPEARAFSLLDAHRGALGKAAGAPERWRTLKLRAGEGKTVVRAAQLLYGVPVFGAQAVVHLQEKGGATIIAQLAGGMDGLGAPEAGWAPLDALTALAAHFPRAVAAEGPVLVVFAPELLGLPGAARYVWVCSAAPGNAPQAMERFFIDAATGEVVFRHGAACAALFRRIYDANSGSEIPFVPTRDEGAPAVGQIDVDTAYDYAGQFYDFLMNRFGRDSVDDEGGALRLVVRYCTDTAPCPYGNAFYTIGRAFFGEGFALADDVVGHELAHGITDEESGLIYYGQAGAISEAFSDFLGEGFDLTNGAGTDTPAVYGKMGEDVPGLGAFRDFGDPTLFSDPDSTCSEFWYDGPADGGGIHTNNGVLNKLVSLLANGGKHNDETVTPLASGQTLELFYEVNVGYLTPTANFEDFYRALVEAATDLGYGAAAIDNIEAACRAVGITPETNCRAVPPPPANDLCADAAVAVPGTPLAGTNVNATGTGETTCGPSDHDDFLDVWYRFTADSDFTVVTLDDGLLFPPTLRVGLLNCGTPVATACDTSEIADPIIPPLVQISTVPGTEYFVRIAGRFATAGDFTLLVNAEPPVEGEGEGEGEGGTEGEGEGEGEDGAQAADQDGNFVISLSELLRVIQFYNSGGYHCADAPEDSEDGFLPGAGANQGCAAHDTDYNPQNWVVGLSELLRLIQFYNSGGYSYCPGSGTEDDFCPAVA